MAPSSMEESRANLPARKFSNVATDARRSFTKDVGHVKQESVPKTAMRPPS